MAVNLIGGLEGLAYRSFGENWPVSRDATIRLLLENGATFDQAIALLAKVNPNMNGEQQQLVRSRGEAFYTASSEPIEGLGPALGATTDRFQFPENTREGFLERQAASQPLYDSFRRGEITEADYLERLKAFTGGGTDAGATTTTPSGPLTQAEILALPTLQDVYRAIGEGRATVLDVTRWERANQATGGDQAAFASEDEQPRGGQPAGGQPSGGVLGSPLPQTTVGGLTEKQRRDLEDIVREAQAGKFDVNGKLNEFLLKGALAGRLGIQQDQAFLDTLFQNVVMPELAGRQTATGFVPSEEFFDPITGQPNTGVPTAAPSQVSPPAQVQFPPIFDLFAEQTSPAAFRRVAQDLLGTQGGGGFGSFNPLMNQALQSLTSQAVRALPFIQSFAGFDAGGLLPELAGTGAAPGFNAFGRDEAFRSFLTDRISPEEMRARLRGVSSVLQGDRPLLDEFFGFVGPGESRADILEGLRTDSTFGQGTFQALSPFIGRGGLDPTRASNIAVSPLLASIAPSLRGNLAGFLSRGAERFQETNPNQTIFDILNRYQSAGFF